MYGKMLVLTFEDNEDDMMSHILSLINTREEIIQMSGLNNHLLNFKGLKIDEVQRVIIRENQEIELTYTEFEIFKLLAKHPGIVFSKEQIYDIVWKESYSGDCLRHLSQKYVFTRMTLILSTKPLSKIMWSACRNRSISISGQMDLGKAERFISETRMESFLR